MNFLIHIAAVIAVVSAWFAIGFYNAETYESGFNAGMFAGVSMALIINHLVGIG
jgi:hypothetical protein